MGLLVKTGTFNLNSALVPGNTLSITGVGFTPKVVLFWSNGRTDVANNVGALQDRRMFGVAVDATHRWVVCGSTDNGASQKSGNARRSDSCIAHRIPIPAAGNPTNTTSFWNSSYDLASMDADGFTLTVVVQALANYQISYMALGGTDITNATVGGFTSKTGGTGSQSIVGVGFQPDLILFGCAETGGGNVTGTNFGSIVGAGVDYPAASFNDAPTMLGFGNSGGAGVAEATDSANLSTTAFNYQRAGEIIGTANSYAGSATGFGTGNGSVDIVATLTSLDANGFTLNYTKNANDTNIAVTDFYYLAIKGMKSAIGNFSTRTDGNNISVSGLSITPAAVLLLSTCQAQSGVSGTFDTNDGAINIGFFTGPTARNALSTRVKNAHGTFPNFTIDSAINFSKAYDNVSNTGTVQGEMDVVSMDSTGFTVKMTTPDVQANFVQYLAFGVTPSASTDKAHTIDAFANDTSIRKAHSIDAVAKAPSLQFLELAGNLIPKITDPNAFVRLNATILAPVRGFVNLAGTLKANARSFVNLNATIQTSLRSYTKLAGTLSRGSSLSHNIDAVAAATNVGFLNLSGTLKQPLAIGACGSFPDVSYVKLAGWLVARGDSIQAPGSGFSPTDDFLSSQLAAGSYDKVSKVILDGINLIVSAFTVGVISYQTRTRSWLRRVDEAPSGILISTEKQIRTLPTGQTVTVITTTQQNQDTTIVTVQTINGNTPNLVSKTVTETNKSGKTISREIQTNVQNGITNTEEKKTVFTKPPTVDNIQPVKVTTLDGVVHYQFFGIDNPEWAGGDQEGLTDTKTTVSIQPSQLNGQTKDQFGNIIYSKVTTVKVVDPTGKETDTTTEEIGTRRDVGTITTDTESDFNGIQTKVHKVVNFPDGTQQITDTLSNNLTGDSVETTTETATDIYGNVTTTTTKIETVTFVDSTVPGGLRQQVTKTVTTQVNGATLNETTTTTNNNFEDDIVNDKIRVFLIQEFTITCVIDWQNMNALLERQITHQQQYALVELFGQQLGNSQLSYALRQRLIQQFNLAANCMQPLLLQALGKTYEVVFAPSASAFRAKYIPGTEPFVYELQLILQERSNLINGTRQFG